MLLFCFSPCNNLANTITDGRQALTDLLGKECFFPITFDEYSIQGKSEAPESEDYIKRRAKNCRHFTFIRSVVRSLLYMPIFIGTNAQAVNFLGYEYS